MSLLQQLMWGTVYLSLCLIIEASMLVWCAHSLRKMEVRFLAHPRRWQHAAILLVAIVFIVAAHTIQVWIWSAAFVWVGALGDWNTSVYFSLVSYTTLGYGDVVLGPALRIFAAFAAVTGLLGFGISTAFLVGAMGQMFGFRNGGGSSS